MRNSIANLAAIAAAILSLAACNKAEKPAEIDLQPIQKHSIKISVDGSSTKVAGLNPGDDVNVKSLDIIVLDEYGRVECYSRVSNSLTTTLNVSAGGKTIYALVNWTDSLPSDVHSEADILALQSRLADNDVDNLHMFGGIAKNITQDENFTINVYRDVARIDIKKITTAFTAPAFTSAEFHVDSIYVINAVGSYPIDDACWDDWDDWWQNVEWFNKQKFQTSDADHLLLDAGVNLVFNGNQSKTVDYSYYVYPNWTNLDDDVHDGAWSNRCTRLVLSARISDGGTLRRVYYPVTLKVNCANKIWSIDELKITRPGSSSPDQPVVSENCNFTVNVWDWYETIHVNESI